MDKANYHLAWYLAERLGRSVTLVAHRVAEPLASHPRVRVQQVARPLGHLPGQLLLDWAGRRAAARLLAERPDAQVLINGANCRWPAACWVHMVHHASRPTDRGAPLLFRLKNRLTHWWFRRQEGRILPASALLLANSHKTRRDLITLVGLAPERIQVVYLGSDADHAHPVSPGERVAARQRFGLHADQLAIVFMGALGHDRNKGFDTLLAAGRILEDRNHQPWMLLAAGGGNVSAWQRRVAALHLEQRVHMLGLIEHTAELLAAADLLVSPTRYDAYGLAVHEALCRGCPAIVSRAAGVAERYPPQLHDLLLDDPDSPQELADRIVGWRSHAASYRPVLDSLAAELRVRTWDDVAADVVALLESSQSPASPEMHGACRPS